MEATIMGYIRDQLLQDCKWLSRFGENLSGQKPKLYAFNPTQESLKILTKNIIAKHVAQTSLLKGC